MSVPAIRITRSNAREVNPSGSYVIYWMIANRRPVFNFALQRATEQARALGKGLLVLEALRCNYPYASERLHAFVIEGMIDNATHFARTRARYIPYVEPEPDAGKGLLRALAARACLVVTDDCPSAFLPRMVERAAADLPVALEKVDSNGLLPIAASDRVFSSAHEFRRVLQAELPGHLEDLPLADPLDGTFLPPVGVLPREVTERWPATEVGRQAADRGRLATLPVEHRVAPVAQRGGFKTARKTLAAFLDGKLDQYDLGRNHPDADATSSLSPYLHFGHIGPHEVLSQLGRRLDWSPASLPERHDGSRTEWWGMSSAAEAFLDELVTWRELAINFAAKRDDVQSYESLPGWARKSLEAHIADERPHVYSLEQLRSAATHDSVWNAAQRQLSLEGRVHGYLRMLWGKKILEWSPTPRDAVAAMIELNDSLALDGRDPNSYAGIMWCLGRYDRPWAPERPIFGCVRYMSSAATIRKLHLREYLRRFGGDAPEEAHPG
jgi:deoxyribodipyrimidine photo-lyase